MKKLSLILLGMTFLWMSAFAQYPDLPGGGGNYNLQTLSTGSYVIAMDNRHQGSGTGSFTATINNRAFNYVSGNTTMTAVVNTTGILVGMTVTGQAAIPAGTTVTAVTATTVTLSAAPTATANNKDLDFGYITYSGADFNLKAYGLLVHLLNNNIKLKWVIKPGKAKDAVDFSVNASRVKPTAGATAVYDFVSGPFVIFQQDTTGVAALVQSFNGAASADDVKMYKTNAPVSVDVRYDYVLNGSVWKPKAAIMDDGGNAQIHESYMVNAGVPTSNFSIELAPQLVFGCFTFASEPHNSNAPQAVMQQISQFVHFGGNFLAQCAAARTYEDSPFGRYQSVNGFNDENGGSNPNPVLSNTDMAYFQINGYFGVEDEGGSLKSWENTSPKNNYHVHTTNTVGAQNFTNASVAKVVTPANLGGMVFYLGSHSYDGSNDYDINGQRLYLNAFLVPTNPQGTLHSAAVLSCGNLQGGPLVVNTGSSQGPSQAYPMTFTLYEDLAPAGYNVGDPQRGNVVTMTGPNTYQGGVSTITAAGPTAITNYVIAIRPALACFTNKFLLAVCEPPLPVSLLSFTATRNSSLVNLKWATSSEANSAGFNVERQVGTGNWETVGYVSSRASGGSSVDRLDYTFVDHNSFKGVTQYRLKHMNLDNSSKFSDIRTVRGEDGKGSVLVYPNPSDGKVNIVFDSQARRDLSLNDMSGRVVKQIRNITANSISIDNLAPGMYTVRVVNNDTGDQTVEKIVVNKR